MVMNVPGGLTTSNFACNCRTSTFTKCQPIDGVLSKFNFQGRATEADLTPLGRSQMGLPPLDVRPTVTSKDFAKAGA